DVPCIPRTSCTGVTCGTVSDGCGGTISCCAGSGCTPVSCNGCQTLSACGDVCNNLLPGSNGTCPLCQTCNGSGACAFVANGQQDVGCDGPANQCLNGVCICTGCISGSVCYAGSTTSQCGTGGAACVSCDDGNSCTNDSCSSGTCGY